MPLVIEKDIERRLKARVEDLGGWCLKFNPVSDTGIPDRIVLLPGGILRFVEVKRPVGGRVSAIQEYQHQKLRALGFPVEIVKTYEDIDLMLERVIGGDT